MRQECEVTDCELHGGVFIPAVDLGVWMCWDHAELVLHCRRVLLGMAKARAGVARRKQLVLDLTEVPAAG